MSRSVRHQSLNTNLRLNSQEKHHPSAIDQHSRHRRKPTFHLQINRRIEGHHTPIIHPGEKRARRPLRHIPPTIVLGALVQHIRLEAPVGPELHDGVPLVLVLEVVVAEVMAVARWDEVVAPRLVPDASTLVRFPDEAAGGFGIACLLELGDA